MYSGNFFSRSRYNVYGQCKSSSQRESWIVRYLLLILGPAELNEESVRVRKGCGYIEGVREKGKKIELHLWDSNPRPLAFWTSILPMCQGGGCKLYVTEVDSNPCAGEQRERRYLSGQVLDITMMLIRLSKRERYLLLIPHQAELNEGRGRVRLGQKGCSWNRVEELEREDATVYMDKSCAI